MKTSPTTLLFSQLILILTVVSISISQTDSNQTTEDKKSSKYLQIGFINETALYYHFTLNKSLRLKSGIDVNWNYDEKKDGDGYNRSQLNYPPYVEEEKRKANSIDNSYEITASSIVFFQLNDYEYASLYLGIGPSLSYSYAKTSSHSSSYADTTFYNSGFSSVYKVFGIGPSVSLMITSHIYGMLFLVSEYDLATYYTWNTDDNGFTYSSKSAYSTTISYESTDYHQESKGWKLRLSSVKVGLLIEL